MTPDQGEKDVNQTNEVSTCLNLVTGSVNSKVTGSCPEGNNSKNDYNIVTLRYLGKMYESIPWHS